MAKNKTLVINPKWCKGCGICVAFCPKNVLAVEHEKVHMADEEACIKWMEEHPEQCTTSSVRIMPFPE